MASILGENIHKFRTQRGMSASELSHKAGVGTATISQIESGKRQTLKGDTINKIATALGVSVNDLLSDGEVVHFETNDLTDLLSIFSYSDFLELDDEPFTPLERARLIEALSTFIDSVRYRRIKLNPNKQRIKKE